MKKLVIICMLIFVTYTPIVKAGYANSEKSVLTSMLYGSSVVIAILLAPSIVSNSLFKTSDEGSKKIKNASAGTQEKCAAKKLPNMVVKTIDQDENNNPRVYFEVPNNPEQNIAISWNKSDVDPTTVFHEGELVSFNPSVHKSGWLLHNANEVALAFVPLPANLADNYSEFF